MGVRNYGLTLGAFECRLDNGVIQGFLGGTALKCKAGGDPDGPCMKEPPGEFGFNGNLEFGKRGSVSHTKLSMAGLISL